MGFLFCILLSNANVLIADFVIVLVGAVSGR